MCIYRKYQQHIIEKRIPLLNLLFDCLYARSASQILSVKKVSVFSLNFLIIA